MAPAIRNLADQLATIAAKLDAILASLRDDVTAIKVQVVGDGCYSEESNNELKRTGEEEPQGSEHNPLQQLGLDIGDEITDGNDVIGDGIEDDDRMEDGMGTEIDIIIGTGIKAWGTVKKLTANCNRAGKKLTADCNSDQRKLTADCNHERFKEIYIFTFDWAKEKGQKSLALDTAIGMWQLLFAVKKWPLVDHWCQFLQAKHNKAISRDTWSQLLEFATYVEPGLSNYDAEGAWPYLIDEFVEYLTKNTIIQKDRWKKL